MAGDRILLHSRSGFSVDAKSDGTPVTIADREAETLIRKQLQQEFPQHGLLGEEHGALNPGAHVQWIVDPIDGTKSFVHGVPLYGVLIGVEVAGEPMVGVAYLPALDDMVVAAKGEGCWWNGHKASVSDTRHMDEAVVLTTSLGWALDSASGFRDLVSEARFSRTWGDCYGHVLVATGRADVMVDPVLARWDAGPLLTILSEAGGRFTDLGGVETVRGGSGVSTNGHLHAHVLSVLTKRGHPETTPKPTSDP